MQGREGPSGGAPEAGWGWLALPAVGVAATLWALAAVVASRLFTSGLTPLQLTGARALVAALGFALIPASWRRPEGPPRPGGFVWVVGMGVALALVTATYYGAIEKLPVAVAIVLQYTAPALVVAASSLLAGRAPSGPVAASLVAALAGVVLVTGAGGSDLGALDPVGVLLGLASAALFASYTLLGERARRDLPALPLMLRVFAVAAIVWFLLPDTRPGTELLEASRLPGVLFVGIGGTLVPFLLYVWAVAHVRSERAAIAATLEPVVAALSAWTWLGQRLTGAQVAGGVLVIVAVLGLARRPEAEVVPPPA